MYTNTIENIKSKDPAYDDAVRSLREYVPAQQKTKNRKGDSTENPVILKTKGKDNGKKCEYCMGKGWNGLNHVESKYYTKKREQKKAQTKGG